MDKKKKELKPVPHWDGCVEYDNWFNRIRLKDFTGIEQDYLLVIFERICATQQIKVTMTYDEVKTVMQWERQHRNDNLFVSTVDKVNEKIAAASVGTVILPSGVHLTDTMMKFKSDPKKREITATLNEDCAFVLIGVVQHWSRVELKAFFRLRGKYAKSLYRHLKEYSASGYWAVTVDDLKAALDIPDGYDNRVIMDKVLKPAMTAVSCYFDNLKVTPHRDGRKISSYLFSIEDKKDDSNQLHLIKDGFMEDKPMAKLDNPVKRRRKKEPQIEQSDFGDMKELEKRLIQN